MIMIPARVSTEVNDGASCGLPADRLARVFRNSGCREKDAALCLNTAVCALCPCMYVIWRTQLRKFYNIDVRTLLPLRCVGGEAGG